MATAERTKQQFQVSRHNKARQYTQATAYKQRVMPENNERARTCSFALLFHCRPIQVTLYINLANTAV